MISTTMLSAIVVLGVLIFVHELGHFLVAKRKGVGVKRFSLGFGPKLVGRKIGETEYLISAVPLGGYVKMLGEAPGEEVAPDELARSFTHQTLWRRTQIVVAGPLFNLGFAVFAFALIFFLGFPVLTATVGEVKEGFPAAQGGLKGGDRVVAIDGVPVANWEKMAGLIRRSTADELRLTVSREGREVELSMRPRMDEVSTPFGEKVRVRVIGISPSGVFVKERSPNPIVALYKGAERTAKMTVLIVVGLVKLLQGIVPASDLGGPLLIAKLAGESAKGGLITLLHFMAFLSVNLAILNLLPIPVLDGGHLAFFAVEGIIGRPVSLKKREFAQQVGLFLLIMLMVFVFYNDLSRFVAAWFQN